MDLAELGVKFTSDGHLTTVSAMRGVEVQAGRTERAATVLGNTFRMLAPLAGALMAAFSVNAMRQYADQWSDMSSRVGIAVRNMEAAPAVMGELERLARTSYSSLGQTVDAFANNATALRDLGYSTRDTIDYTEALNHALVTTATRGQRAESVQNALSKAMATGRLQADGLETVLANGGRVAEALADELGTTVSGLRGMASQGQITGDVIARALIGNLEELRRQAGEMPATLEDAGQIWNNTLTAVVGSFDKAFGASESLATNLIGMADAFRAGAQNVLTLGLVLMETLSPAFDFLGQQMGNLAGYSGVAVAAMAGFFAPAMLTGLATVTTAIGVGLVGAIRAVGAAMLANPMGLLIAGISAAVAASFIFRDQIRQTIGIDVVDTMIDAGNKTIGALTGAYEAVREAWNNLPLFFSAIGKQAWNNLLEAMSGDAITWKNPFTGEEHSLLSVDFTGAQQNLSPEENRALRRAEATFNQAYNRDYIRGMGDAIGGAWTNADGATAALDGLRDSISGAAGQAGQLSGALAGAGTDSVSGALQHVAGQTHWFASAALTAFSNMGTGFAEAWRKGGDVGMNVLQMLMDRVGRLGETLLNNGLNGLLNMGINAIFGGMGGSWGATAGGNFFTPSGFVPGGFFPGIPGYAGGTDFHPGGLAWVGEKGKELVNLPRGSQVIPHQQSLGLTSGTTVQVIDQRTNAPAIEREEGIGPNGERQVRLIVKDEVKSALWHYDEGLDRRFQRGVLSVQSDPRRRSGHIR